LRIQPQSPRASRSALVGHPGRSPHADHPPETGGSIYQA
jgi:hypothetical protein